MFLSFDEETHNTKWKQFVPEFPNYHFSMEWNAWSRRDELIAFRYEFLRRISAGQLPEYPQIPQWLLSFVQPALSDPPQRDIARISTDPLPGYAKLLNWEWDLTASDEALLSALHS